MSFLDTDKKVAFIVISILFCVALTWRHITVIDFLGRYSKALCHILIKMELITKDPRISMAIVTNLLIFVSFFILISTVNVWIGLFLLLAVVFSRYPETTDGSRQALGNILLMMVWFYICIQIITDEKRVSLFLGLICLAGIANAVILIFQHFNLDLGVKVVQRTGLAFDDIRTGLMDCRNSASAILAVTLPAFFRRRWWYLIPLILIGLVLSKSTGGVMAAGVVIVVYSMYRMPDFVSIIHRIPKMQSVQFMNAWTLRTVWAAFIVCLTVFYLQFIDSPGMIGRLTAWLEASQLFMKHPYIGAGLSQWKVLFADPTIRWRTFGLYYAQAHNEFIQVAIEMGIFSIITIIGYFVSVAKRMHPGAIIPALAILAVCVNSLVFFPMHIWFLALISVTWLAILEVKLKFERTAIHEKTATA